MFYNDAVRTMSLCTSTTTERLCHLRKIPLIPHCRKRLTRSAPVPLKVHVFRTLSSSSLRFILCHLRLKRHSRRRITCAPGRRHHVCTRQILRKCPGRTHLTIPRVYNMASKSWHRHTNEPFLLYSPCSFFVFELRASRQNKTRIWAT